LSCSQPIVGMPGDVPQWHCQGSLSALHVIAVLTSDGGDGFGFEAQVPEAADRQPVIGAFIDLVEATPALASNGANVRTWLQAWDGTGTFARFGKATLGLQSDAAWITLASRVPG
jgi:hypothetical protein